MRRRFAQLVARTDGLTVTAPQYAVIARVALVALAAIVATGAAVRLTGSGLGCPDWPKCYGRALPPLDTHAVIEFGNRVVSGIVGVIAVAAGALAFRRRPFRRDLAVLGILLPLGVVGQAVLGGLTVRERLAPGYVMAHFALSMIILAAAVALLWRAQPAGRSAGRRLHPHEVWALRGLLGLAALAIFAGTAATAAGPHAGGQPGQAIARLNYWGAGTLEWMIRGHGVLAGVLGVAVVGVLLWLARTDADEAVRRALGGVGILLALQGAVGVIQYHTHLPAELVWVHVTLATLTWLGALWVTALAGPLRPRQEVRAVEPAVRERERRVPALHAVRSDAR